jgi:hypothetical protein
MSDIMDTTGPMINRDGRNQTRYNSNVRYICSNRHNCKRPSCRHYNKHFPAHNCMMSGMCIEYGIKVNCIESP